MTFLAMVICCAAGGALVAESTDHPHPHWTGFAGIVLTFAGGYLAALT